MTASQSTPAIDAPLKEKATLVGRIGFMMLSVGTGAWRVRASMNKIARGLNITCNADIGLLSIEYTCVDGSETFTNAISLSNTGINTHRLSEIEDFADNFADTAKKYSTEQIHMILDKFQSMPGKLQCVETRTRFGSSLLRIYISPRRRHY